MPKESSGLSSDFSLIEDAEARDHPAYEAFAKEMEGRAYGSEALNDAWLWFKRGWDMCPESNYGPADYDGHS